MRRNQCSASPQAPPHEASQAYKLNVSGLQMLLNLLFERLSRSKGGVIHYHAGNAVISCSLQTFNPSLVGDHQHNLSGISLHNQSASMCIDQHPMAAYWLCGCVNQGLQVGTRARDKDSHTLLGCMHACSDNSVFGKALGQVCNLSIQAVRRLALTNTSSSLLPRLGVPDPWQLLQYLH
jgi:hypothetical protein